MRTQPTPLYATNEAGEAFQVIGWSQDRSTGRICPEVIQLNKLGPAQPRQIWRPQEQLTYLTEVPVTAADRDESAADTAFIERVRDRTDTVPAPDWAHPRY